MERIVGHFQAKVAKKGSLESRIYNASEKDDLLAVYFSINKYKIFSIIKYKINERFKY